MVREGGRFSAIAIVVHVVGIAAGLYLGWIAVTAIAPDLPADDVQPGIASSVAPGAVAGDDPDSLFAAGALDAAFTQLEEQLPAGHGIVRLRIEPGTLDAETRSGEGLFELDDVSTSLPARLIFEIHAQRAQVTAHDIGYMELIATERGPRWYVQLDTSVTDVDPPWTYGAPLEGSPLTVGPGEPQALAP